MSSVTTREKQIELDKVSLEVKKFKGLAISKSCTNAVPGEGNPDAEIMFIGEAPGFNEDIQGRPFVGQAGKLLEKTLTEVLDIRRADVYITNVIKFRPPDNRDPLPEEIEACRSWLDRQIAIIRPRIIVTLGRFSLAKFIPDITISRVHGQSRYMNLKIENSELKIIVFPMYHPAAALRAGAIMSQFVQDFNKLKSLLHSGGPPLISEAPVSASIIQPGLF